MLPVLPRGGLGRLGQLCPRLPGLPPFPGAGPDPDPSPRRPPEHLSGEQDAPAERPRVDAAQRDAIALELRAAGASFRVIADRLSVSVSTAWKCVDRGLAATRQEPSGKLRKLERERLDRLTVEAVEILQAHHVVVSGGKIVVDDDTGPPLVNHGPRLAAINTLVRLMERRARLEGLDEPTRADVTARIHAEVYSADALDQQLERLNAELAELDPEAAEHERRRQDLDRRLDHLRVAWSTPGRVAADPARFVADALDVCLHLLDLDAQAREQAAAEVEQMLWERAR